MRVVVQRVSRASVKVNDKVVGSIDSGLLIFLGIHVDDEEEDCEWLVKKSLGLRIFNDPNGVMNLSLNDIGGSALIISQFTLQSSTKKGNRPSYLNAARPEKAIPLYEKFVNQYTFSLGKEKVKTGIFGADMKVSLLNDGPVTILIDSKNKE